MWNSELIDIIGQTSSLLVNGPPEVARQMSLVDSAMFDAANAASGRPYQPVAYSGPAVAGASADAAALAAGYTAMRGIFANNVWANAAGGSASVQTAVLSRIDAAYIAGLNGLGITQAGSVPNLGSCTGSSSAACLGLALGQATGNANLVSRGHTIGDNSAGATDGSYAAIIDGLNPNAPAGSGTVKGVYVPPAARPEMYRLWGAVKPSGITPAQLATAMNTVSGPPALDSQAYARDLMATQCTGAGSAMPAAIQGACAAAGFAPQTAAQAKAALFWNDPGTTLQPPGHWLQITNTVAQTQGLSTLETARVSSLVGQAELDAGIAAWALKYQYNLWRPITAIRDCAVDTADGTVSWNSYFTTCDTGWTSLIATPPHPDYVAGHPAFSAAAAKVLENYFGPDNIPFVSISDAYCNGGTTRRGASTGLIVACTIGSGSRFTYNGGNTIYSTEAGCTDAGGILGTSGPDATCILDGITFTYNPANTGCNNIVDGGSNDSLLICPITLSFDSFSAAATGPNGSEFSRLAGGIHTPSALLDASTVGFLIGQSIASNANIPEPASLALLTLSLAGCAVFRRRMAAPCGSWLGRGQYPVTG